jgi:hypothetical protein
MRQLMKSIPKLMLLLGAVTVLHGCSESNYEHPRNEKLLEYLPVTTLHVMEQHGMPRDAQIALTMRFNTAICQMMVEDINNKDFFESYQYTHDKAVLLVSTGWETSEGPIPREWTRYPVLERMWFPIEMLTCVETVDKYVSKYGKN